LSQANDNLRREIADKQKAEKALKEIVSTIEGQLKELKEGILFRSHSRARKPQPKNNWKEVSEKRLPA
jgi:uncharacterized FlaG/YvyC family protein